MDEKIAMMQTKSVCVGRFMVDVPKDAEVTFRSASVAGWDISTIQESEEVFVARSKRKEEILSAEKNEHGGISLETIQEIRGQEVNAKLVVYGRRWIGLMRGGKKVVSETVEIEGFARSNGISYEFKGKLRRPSHFDQLKKIVNQLQARPEDTVPAAAGFCFDRGFIHEPLTADENEYAAIFLGLREYPDLAISLSTSAGIDPGKTLLQRNEENDVQKEFRSRFHRLRVGARALNGIPGEEVLQRVDESNGVKVHGFMWESLADKNDVYLPSLSLELDTGLGRPGKPVNSSLSDTEALALWDKISSSLRRRPVEPAKSASTAKKES